MEGAVAKLLTPAVLQEAAARFGTHAGALTPLEAFENFVYGFDTESGGRILRLSHLSHRTSDEVTAELEWLTYLADNGASVARALPSRLGKWVEEVPVTDSAFYVCLFERAPGFRLEANDTHLWNETLFTAWGRTVGQLHRLTKDYRPGRARRVHWSDEDHVRHAARVLQDEPFALAKLKALTAEIDAFPRTRERYGLIHTDVHPGNFFVDAGRLTVFDFDDSSYHYFAQDVAMALYYALARVGPDETTEAFAARFLPAFLAGYAEENRLEPLSWKTLTTLLLARDIVLYIKLQQKWEPALRGLKPAQLSLLERFKHRIDTETPRVRLEGVL